MLTTDYTILVLLVENNKITFKTKQYRILLIFLPHCTYPLNKHEENVVGNSSEMFLHNLLKSWKFQIPPILYSYIYYTLGNDQ